MAVLAWITGIILTLAFLMSGGMKLMGQPMALEMANRLGFANLRQAIGATEVVGAVGVFLGLLSNSGALLAIGYLAAIGLIALMIGAVTYHIRAGDEPKDYAPAVAMGVLALIYLIAIAGR